MAIGQDKARALPGTAGGHPERFDPERHAKTLMDSEHRGRYWWAAQMAAGRSILDAGCGTGYGLEILAAGGAGELTGVDVDPGALTAARRRAERCGATVVQGDLRSLELADDSFDLAVCFETIEHLDSPEQGVAELRRVVRPGGTLVVSSPNPDVYPAGNEHHVRELRLEELVELVGAHFPSTRVYLQHAWLASMIEPRDGSALAPSGERPETGAAVRRSRSHEADGTTFAIVVGCDAELGELPPLISLGDPFEVRWWEERITAEQERAQVAISGASDSIEGAAQEAVAAAEREAQAQVQAAERRAREAEERLNVELARAEAKLAQQEAGAAAKLRDAGAALIDANQELAELPLVKHRLAEMHHRNAALKAQLDALTGSRSWQITGFLRRLSATLKLQR